MDDARQAENNRPIPVSVRPLRRALPLASKRAMLRSMSEFTAWIYTAAWSTALLCAAFVVARDVRRFELFSSHYLRTMLRPWRLATGIVATGFFVLAAPYANDPTWDRTLGFFMGALTWLTAPWSVGTLWQAVRRKRGAAHAYVAACVWLWSASWSYDFYTWQRLGVYPASWSSNLAASSVLYALAGLCWSLTSRDGVGVTFTFLWPEWPAESVGSRVRGGLVVWVLVFVLAAAALGLPFVVPELCWW
jgi:hypothetical protein